MKGVVLAILPALLLAGSCRSARAKPSASPSIASASTQVNAAVTAAIAAEQPPPPPDASARVAYTDGPSLCIQTVRPAALGDKACTTLPEAIEQFAWLSKDSLAALGASGDVFLVEAGKAQKLPSPPRSAWDRPPPRDDKGKIQFGADPSDKRHLFVEAGEIWLAKCPYWFGFDAGWCHEWVSVRLHPSRDVRVGSEDPPGLKDAHFLWSRAGQMPPDVSITVDDVETGKTPPLHCDRLGAKSVFVPEGQASRVVVNYTWVPGSLSLYLVHVTYDYGEGEQSVTHLMRACEPKPVDEQIAVVAGPDRFWLHDGKEGWTLRYGDKVIGSLGGDMPAFAPF